jgi:hypothetical protein
MSLNYRKASTHWGVNAQFEGSRLNAGSLATHAQRVEAIQSNPMPRF